MENKFRIVQTGKYKCYPLEHKYIHRDLFYLLSIFLADEKITNTIKGDRDPLWKIFSTEEEIASLIISCAAIARIVMDQKKKKINTLKSIVGILIEKRTTKKLSLREACNKIIHAKELQFEVREIKKNLMTLEPKIILIGNKYKTKWEAEIDIIEFIRKYIAYIK